MKAYEQVAVNFATALVERRWVNALQLLTRSMRREYSAGELEENLDSMYSGYADGPATKVIFDPEVSWEDWPAKQKDDAGMAYVSVVGDDFNEAVTVIVSQIGPDLLIREIIWGRP